MSDADFRTLVADPHCPDPGAVEAAAEVLAQGELLVLPTDTVYGLACRADDHTAVLKLYAAKQRPLTKALPLLLPNMRALQHVAADIGEPLRRLAEQFWPGPLTVVIYKCAAVSNLVTAGRPTVGVRVPDLPLTVAILAACPFPVAVTSANLSEASPAGAVPQLPTRLLEKVALVVDGGPCPGSTPSTVVDVTVAPAQVLRSGPITSSQIRAVLRD